jgi:hypothetical protein
MFQNRPYIRSIIAVGLTLAVILLPWWFFFAAILVIGLAVPYLPYEYAVIGLVADYFFGTPIAIFHNFQYVYAAGALVVVGICILKKLFTR